MQRSLYAFWQFVTAAAGASAFNIAPRDRLLILSFLAAMTVAAAPNVIVIMADDLGYVDMSFLPDAPADVRKHGTPNIDRLAKAGTYFSTAYATSPICSPSRTGFITGRYQTRWGNYWYSQGGLPAKEITIPAALKAMGYATKKVGKTHHNGGEAEHPLKHGFDEFLGFIHHTWDYTRLSSEDLAAYKKAAKGKSLGILCVGPLERNNGETASFKDAFSTDVFTDESIEFIKRDHGGKPFYLQLAYNAVHMPTYVVEQKKYAKLVGLPAEPWVRDAGEWSFPYFDPRKEPWGAWHKKWGHLGAVDPDGRKRYLSHLIAMDDGIGRILKTLDDAGIRKNTLVVFLSDNGGTINTYANNGKLNGYKYMFGEGGIRIPIIVSMPGTLAEGRSSAAVVSAMDLFPTIMDVVGGTAPDNLDGKSLMPLIKGERESQHQTLVWDKGKEDCWVIRHGKWKLANNAGWTHHDYEFKNGQAVRAAKQYTYPDGVQLFDLHADPGETTNLADTNPEVVAELNKLRNAWRKQMSNPTRGKKKGY
jgi:arylsulfatase A-like enzyme